jgi:DNA-binding transcriptional LysR family regulator
MSQGMPELVQLRLLVGISEYSSLGAAAREMRMAQPNASRTLAALERRLGLTLVQRSPSGSRLTTEGTVVVQWARQVIEATDRLIVGAQALRSELSGELHISASMTVAEYLVPLWLTEFHRQHPEVRVNLEVCNSHDVMDRVRDGHTAVGFVESPTVSPGFKTATVGHDHLVVVVTPTHPWTPPRKPITTAELAATALIVREPGSGTRNTLEHLLRGYDLAAPALELSSNAAVKISATTGIAPAVLSNLAVETALGTGELKSIPVDGLNLNRTLRAIWSTHRRLDTNTQELLNVARTAHKTRN